jgi:hypothetical protein
MGAFQKQEREAPMRYASSVAAAVWPLGAAAFAGRAEADHASA